MAGDLAAESAPSPLEEIERRLQDRAKELTLDLRTSADRSSLRRLVDDEVAEWGSQHQRGLRPFALAGPEMVADRVLRNLAGYGPWSLCCAATPASAAPPRAATPARQHPRPHRRAASYPVANWGNGGGWWD